MKLSGKKIWLAGMIICGLGSVSLAYVLWDYQWPVGSNVTFYVNENTAQVPNELAAVNSAAGTWNAIYPAGLTMTYSGTTSVTTHVNDGSNNVYWDDEGSTGTLATAWAWFAGSTFIDTDMVFNDYYDWSTSGEGGTYDIETVALHEFGHWVGLDHSTPGIMAPTYGGEERSVDSDARAGFEAMYGGGGSTDPVIALDTTNMNFSGSDSDTFNVRNSGQGTLNYLVNVNRSWMSVSPSSGSSTGEWNMIDVTADSSGLAAGDYSGTISVTSGDASNSPQEIDVTLSVEEPPPDPTIELDASNINFSESESDSFRIRNSGRGTINFQVNVNRGWMSVLPSSGSSDGEWNVITLTVDSSGLAAGDYSGTISVTSGEASNSPQEINVTLSIEDRPPSVSITSPPAGNIEREIISIEAEASDDFGVEKVEFYIDNDLRKTDTSPPYDYDWDAGPLSPGDYTIKAVAYDTIDQTDEDSIILTITDLSPSVSITSPPEGEIKTKVVTIEATASDDYGVNKVEFYVGNDLQKTDTSPPYDFDWDTSLYTWGDYTIKAKAYDTINQTDEDSVILTIPEDKPPSVTISSPPDGMTVVETVTISANASDDNGVKKVEFYVDNVLSKTDGNAPYTYEWNPDPFTSGFHTIKALAYDTIDQTDEDSIRLKVDKPPNVTLTSPVSGTDVSGLVKIAATAVDDYGIKEVLFYVNMIQHSVDTGIPYTFDWNTNTVQNGNYGIDAVATDLMDQTDQDTISLYVIPHPPENFSAVKKENSSFLLEEHINALTWQAHGLNRDISKYKIYQVVDGNLISLSEVSGATFEYWHRDVERNEEYSYVLTAVDANGREGETTSVVVQ